MIPGSSLSKFRQYIKRMNLTHLQPLRDYIQCVDCFPCGTEDAKHFQPEQELLLQEPMESGYNLGYADHPLIDEVPVPRLAGILQSGVDVLSVSLLQVGNLGVGDGIREVTHILLQLLVH